MQTRTSDESTTSAHDNATFLRLVLGLHSFVQEERKLIPANLRRAMQTIAATNIMKGKTFPKTLHGFLQECHRPISDWYPLEAPPEFDRALPLLTNNTLSDGAKAYYYDRVDTMDLSSWDIDNVNQTTLDNGLMIDLRNRLRQHDDTQLAQTLYVQVRSFIIANSWTTKSALRGQERYVFLELKHFYEPVPVFPTDDLAVCANCGLLRWEAGEWRGIRPDYCSDHRVGAQHVEVFKRPADSFRLVEGAHSRTFLPGRAELNLFEFADDLHESHPTILTGIERYPGLDSCDLRLTFTDGIVWAVDVKDQRDPIGLAKQITQLPNEGMLKHNHAFYVIPDRRMSNVHYRERLNDALKRHLPNHAMLHIEVRSVNEFQEEVRQKVARLEKLTRSRKKK